MLLKKKNVIIEVSDDRPEEIKRHIEEGFNEYKGPSANVKNDNNKPKNIFDVFFGRGSR